LNKRRLFNLTARLSLMNNTSDMRQNCAENKSNRIAIKNNKNKLLYKSKQAPN